MGGDPAQARPARTVLEQYIRDRRMTLEEFAQHVEQFAREHGEPGMLGTRHLQRLIAGKRGDGRPLGPMKPATIRLIERVTSERIEVLLSMPLQVEDESEGELRQMLDTARRVDNTMLVVLNDQLRMIRLSDRQLGVLAASSETRAKIHQVEHMLRHCVTIGTRRQLALLLAELNTLAGWQALDCADRAGAWNHYHQARIAAAESGSEAHAVHAAVEQAYVLLDLARPVDAISLVNAHAQAVTAIPTALRAWLAAARGEAKAANGERADCLRAFDSAESLLPHESSDTRPYVAIDYVHLARWRGHALVQLGEPEAVDILAAAHEQLSPTFVRARTAVTVDLAAALFAAGAQTDAVSFANQAIGLALQVGSVRQQRRAEQLLKRFT